MAETLIVTLTDRRPLKIIKEEWPVLASIDVQIYDREEDEETERKREFKIAVREKKRVDSEDNFGEVLVYGSVSYWEYGQITGGRRGGVLLQPHLWLEIESAMKEVCDFFGMPDWARAMLMAKLPVDESLCPSSDVVT